MKSIIALSLGSALFLSACVLADGPDEELEEAEDADLADVDPADVDLDADLDAVAHQESPWSDGVIGTVDRKALPETYANRHYLHYSACHWRSTLRDQAFNACQGLYGFRWYAGSFNYTYDCAYSTHHRIWFTCYKS